MSDGPIVLAHPSPDLYGADLQMLVTVDVLRGAGYDVLVVMPSEGPLAECLRTHGAAVELMEFPVLRKSVLHPRRLAGFAVSSVGAALRGAALLRRCSTPLLFVNTLTVPSWMAAGRLAQVRVLAHVHEAEEDQPRLIRLMLAGQLLLAHKVIANSAAARTALVDVIGALAERTTVVHNGVPEPAESAGPARARTPADPLRAALVGRLSPRKGTDVALEAVAALRSEGRDVSLDVCGTVFTGYEWFETRLLERAAQPDLAGAVTFHGYVDPREIVAESDLVLVPSRVEPFGNVAVEAMLARRPVVAGRVQGLREVVRDGETGLLVSPGDVRDLADGVRRLMDDPGTARRMADAALTDARARFSLDRYARGVVDVLATVHPDGGDRPVPVSS